MKNNPKKTKLTCYQVRRVLSAALAVGVALLVAGFAPNVAAQTLKLKYGFEDTGTTTADSVAGVSLNIVNSAGTAADLHGAAATGVNGLGKALDFTSGPGGQSAAPLASTTANAALGFGQVNAWTAVEWLKPTTTANMGSALSRFYFLGTNGTVDSGTAANSFGCQVDAGGGAAFQFSADGTNPRVSGITPSPAFANNHWTFIALTYDGVNLTVYAGDETTVVTQVKQQALTPAQAGANFGTSGSLFLGNRSTRVRGFQGYIDDFRFYTGAASSNYLESVRQEGIGTAITAPATLPGAMVTAAGTASSAQSVSISAANLTADVTATAAANFEISKNGSTWASSVTYAKSSGNDAVGTLYVRLSASAALNGYDSTTCATLASTGATSVNVSTTASGNAVSASPTIVVAGTLPGVLFTASGTASGSQAVAITGISLTGNITATAVSNFEVSSDNSTWGTTASYTQSGGTASGNLYVRLSATASQGVYDSSNCVALTASGATTVNVATTSSGNFVGGSGVWNIASGGTWGTATNWLNSVVALGSGNTADFSQVDITANATVNVNLPITIGNLNFGDTDTNTAFGWTLSGSALTLTTFSGTPTVNVAALASGNAATISSVITGTNGLTKTGNGTLAFSSQETYTGNTTINGGILNLTGGGVGGNGTVRGTATVNTGCTLQLSAGDVTGYNGGAACLTNINLVGGTLNINTIANQTLGGAVINLTGGAIAGVAGANLDFFVGGSAVNTLASSTTATISGTQIRMRQNNGVTFTVASGSTASGIDLDVSSVIASATGYTANNLIKTGSGTMSLSGANTYTGNTTISNGTLVVDATGSLGTGAVTVMTNATLLGTGTIGGATVIQAGGTLAIGTTNTGALTINNTLTLNAGSTSYLKIDKTGGTPVTDVVQGLSSVTYRGTLIVTNITSDATLLVAGDNFQLFSAGTYAGLFANIILPALPTGLSWDVTGLATSGNIAVSDYAATPMFNPPSSGNVGALPVTITSESGATIYYTTDGSDPTTSGTVLSGASPVTVIVPANTINMTITAYASKAGEGNSVNVSATYSTLATLTWISAGGGSWSVGGNWLNNVVANGSGVAADISTLTLSADTTITLDTPATVGQLVFADQGSAFNWILADGGAGPLTLAGTITPNILVSNQTATISAVLTGTQGLTKTGNGTLELDAVNTYTDNTTISGGPLTIGSAGQLGSGTYAANITNNTAFNYGSSAAQTLSGMISGTGSLTNSGSGTLTLSGATANTYSGLTTVSGGQLTLNKTAGVNAVGGNIAVTGGTLVVSASNQIPDSSSIAFSGTGILASAVTDTVGDVSATGNGGRFNLGSGSAFTASSLELTNTGTGAVFTTFYSLAANGNASILRVGSGGLTMDGASFSIGQSGNGFVPTLILNGNFTGVNTNYLLDPTTTSSRGTVDLGGSTRTFDIQGTTTIGPIIQNGGLTKTDNGTLVLTGANTYTGPTTVSNGTLLVNGTLAAGSAVTVKSGATLGGTGTINGAVTNNGTFAPGTNGLGTLSVNNVLLLNSGGSTMLAIDRTSDTNTYGRAIGMTSVAFNGSLTVTNLGGTFQNGDSFTLFSAGSYSGNFTATNLPVLGTGSTWNWNPASGVLSVVAAGPSGPVAMASSLSGSTLNLTWPAGQGWRLVSQTNSLSTGMGTNWGTVSGAIDGSDTITIDPSKPTVFYRLVYP